MENAVNRRGVDFLVHFTQASNLKSIFEHGILSVNHLKENDFIFEANDEYRYDKLTSGSCFSINFPNYRMFYSLRQSYPGIDWVVLGIDKSVLWEKDCIFCKENAASNNESLLSLKSRQGVNGFNRIYEEFEGKPLRSVLNIDNSLPTNPQAEVLVIGEIEPRYILGAAFESDLIMNKYKKDIPDDISSFRAEYFYSSRLDYLYWRKD